MNFFNSKYRSISAGIRGKLLPCLFLAAAAAILTGAAFGIATHSINRRSYMRCRDIAARYSLKYLPHSGKDAVYRGAAGEFKVFPNKRKLEVNGIKVDPSFVIAEKWGSPYLSELDFKKNISVLFEPKNTLRKHKIASIVLDPGHGGKDKGASGSFSQEKRITYAIALRTAAILRSCGYKVYISRNRDSFLSLSARAKFQRTKKADIFVSIHINSAKDSSVRGIESFALTPVGAPSSGNTEISSEHNSGNNFDNNNLALAYQLQKAMLRRTGAADRGVKRARFAVLREISAPGALIEAGFISNKNDEKLLNSPDYQEKIARAVAEGIIAYHKLLK
jgi:N-acetylmuramoyl-L-alanine amidase